MTTERISDLGSWLAFMVAMLRKSHDCLSFEDCERHRNVASPCVRTKRPDDDSVAVQSPPHSGYFALIFSTYASASLPIFQKRNTRAATTTTPRIVLSIRPVNSKPTGTGILLTSRATWLIAIKDIVTNHTARFGLASCVWVPWCGRPDLNS